MFFVVPILSPPPPPPPRAAATIHGVEADAETLALLKAGTRKYCHQHMMKDIALHGAREASRALRTYATLTRTEQGGDEGMRWVARPGPSASTRGSHHGSGRKPVAYLYTRKRLSFSLSPTNTQHNPRRARPPRRFQ